MDFQQVDSSNGKPSKEVIVVSVREKIIQQLKKLFSTAKISVHVIELDIFAAIRAIKNNYDLTGDKLVALIEIDEIGIQVTIVKDQNFFLSQEISSSKLGLENKSLKEIDEVGQARLIAREMRRIVQDHQFGESVESINRIFLYGNVVKDGLVENLQNTYNVRIDKTNPFRNLFIGPKASTDDKISSHPEAFTVCIGSALR